MKQLIPAFLLLTLFTGCTAMHRVHTEKPAYQQVADDETKVLTGKLNRALIEHDTAFKWFAENMKWGQADPAAVAAFTKHGAHFTMMVFGGTWCHDTQSLLPEFYRLVDKSGYPDKQITLIGVDRAKTAPGNPEKLYKVENVPTFIVLKDGKEVGRVVEYGSYGKIDKELGEIVTKAFE